MTHKLFLYGGFAENFANLIIPFVEASGGKDANIVILFKSQTGWDKYVSQYRKVLENAGVSDIHFIAPADQSNTLTGSDLELIQNATGIFMSGGNTSIYKNIYFESDAGNIISDKYYSGIPYAGLSAGAILAAEKFYSNEYGPDVHDGFGFLKNILIEPHFLERNGFSELVNQFEKIAFSIGIGINEDICLEISNETNYQAIGNSKLYLIKKLENSFEITEYETRKEIKI